MMIDSLQLSLVLMLRLISVHLLAEQETVVFKEKQSKVVL